MYKPEILANSILTRMHKQKRRVNHMGLQKLMYFAYGWSMALRDNVLCSPPEAWKYGPIFPTVFQSLQYKGHDWLKSNDYISTYSVERDECCPLMIADSSVGDVLDQVVDKYGHFDALRLATMARDGVAWSSSREAKMLTMANSSIRLDFQQKLEKATSGTSFEKPSLRLVVSNTTLEDGPHG